MPGLIGFTVGKKNKYNTRNVLIKMQDSITHSNFQLKDILYFDHKICASRTHINISQKSEQPFKESSIYIWLDGEFYNQQVLMQRYEVNADNDLELLYALFMKCRDFSFLKEIDGIYSAVMYFKNKNKLYLFNDLLGYRHLYWTIIESEIVWSSELKAFPNHPYFKPTINELAVDDFITTGYISGEKTWFTNVQLLSPATIICYEMASKKSELKTYWDWSDFKKYNGCINRQETIEEMNRLFKIAVKKRCNKNFRMGIELSGGLDSRAILAAVPEDYMPLHSVTYGKNRVKEKRIAAKVAELKGSIHYDFEINYGNWLYPRLEGVWWTDGQNNLKHMHGIEMFKEIRSLYDIVLTGNHASIIKGKYYNIKNEIEMLKERENRFINMGAKLRQCFVELRRPFIDKDFLTFTLSIPENIRANGMIFHDYLLFAFPEYFKNIPYEKYGTPISAPYSYLYLKRIIAGISRRMHNKGLKWFREGGYTDYFNWIQSEPSRSFFYSVLDNREAIYTEFISPEIVLSLLKDHMDRNNNKSEILCRYLTLEIWFQQLYNKKYRPEILS